MQAFLRVLRLAVPYGCKTTCCKANFTAVRRFHLPKLNITLRSKISLLFLGTSGRRPLRLHSKTCRKANITADRQYHFAKQILLSFCGTPRRRPLRLHSETCRKANFTAVRRFHIPKVNITLRSKTSPVFVARTKTNRSRAATASSFGGSGLTE